MIFLKKLSSFINILLPHLCPSCKAFTASDQGLCDKCAPALSYIGENHCKTCHIPFDLAVGSDMECGACIKTPPFFDKIYAPFRYEGTIVKLILQLKHHDALHIVPLLSGFLKNYIENHNITADIMIPVPLHHIKLLKRKYNQSHLLAKHLVSDIHIPLEDTVLKRIKDGSQKGKNKSEREKNVKNAFIISDAHKIKNKHILVLDDVITTGATVNEIARLFKRHGAKKVTVISLARVSFNRHNNIDF